MNMDRCRIVDAQRRECAGRGQGRGDYAGRDHGVRDRHDAEVLGVASVTAGDWLGTTVLARSAYS